VSEDKEALRRNLKKLSSAERRAFNLKEQQYQRIIEQRDRRLGIGAKGLLARQRESQANEARLMQAEDRLARRIRKQERDPDRGQKQQKQQEQEQEQQEQEQQDNQPKHEQEHQSNAHADAEGTQQDYNDPYIDEYYAASNGSDQHHEGD
jgi:hypothetical protein